MPGACRVAHNAKASDRRLKQETLCVEAAAKNQARWKDNETHARLEEAMGISLSRVHGPVPQISYKQACIIEQGISD